MRQIRYFILILLSQNTFAQHPEKYFKFIEPNRDKINSKITQIVSIDRILKDTVWAYANLSEFDNFQKLGYEVEILTPPSLIATKALNMATEISQMENWDRYPTYTVYREMMKKFEADYPTLCKLDSIGTSTQGRKLYVVKISDNVNAIETEPEVLYTSTIHGDETTGFILMLRLINHLLSQYNIDPRIRAMVDNMAIYINPNANPDGTYYGGNNTVIGSRRYNANNIDLNRNFPDPRLGDHPDGYSWQIETKAMMDFATQRRFIISANFHGGIELANYPWDTWTSTTKKHPDHNWYYTISRAYADTVHKYSPSDYFTGESNGVTHGGDWYVVAGGRQDYMNYWHNCREITLEISDVKLLSTDLLPAYWNYNKASMLNYIELAYTGFYGTVTNNAGEPLPAKIAILNHDIDNSEVITNPQTGAYYRAIAPGTYSITYSADGYSSYTLNDVSIPNNNGKIINVVLDGNLSNQNISGVIQNETNNQPIPGASINLISGNTVQQATTNANGEFTINSVPTGIIRIQVEAEGFYATTQHENLTSAQKNFTIKLLEKQSISGYTVNAETKEPIPGVTISNSALNISTTSDNEGFFQLKNLVKGANLLNTKKIGFANQKIEIILPQNNPLSINLPPIDPEGFETSIPTGINFGDGDWARDNTTSYDGSFGIKSYPIENSQQTTMSINLNLVESGEISFARKVSSEKGYDFLKFYIDGVEKGSWSGEVDWEEESFPVTAGNHTFAWKYIKDGNAASGSDCVWIDYIYIPKNSQTLKFSVKINETPHNDITVICNNETGTTDSDGTVTFHNIPKGNIPFRVLYEGTELGNSFATVYWSDIEYPINCANYSNVSFLVKNNNGNPISNASVTLNQSQQITNKAGIAAFSDIPYCQTCNYSVTSNGYENALGNIKVYRDSTYTITIYQTGIDSQNEILKTFTISPNPFKDKTTIACELSKPSIIEIDIYDISGHLVLKVFDGELPAGEYRWNWEHNEYPTMKRAQNIYIVKFKCNGKTISKKIIHIN